MSLKRDANKIVKAAKFFDRATDRLAPKVAATGQAGEVSFGEDGPPATKHQRRFVEFACNTAVRKGILAAAPELPEDLTIGQAEGILSALGVPVDDLYKGGRDYKIHPEQAAWKASRA